MTNKDYKKIIILNIIFLAVIGTSIYFYLKKPEPRPIVVPVPEEIYTGPVSTSTPVRVLIPEVGIDGNVIPVGIAASGNMAVPVKYEDVGWYKYGPTPGQKGNAVLAGHFDDGRGKPAIFYKLNQVKVGDIVYVENDSGEKMKFIVREIRLVDYANPSQEDMEAVFGKDISEGLNLITCDGVWIPEKKTYSDRLIVFTDRVNS